ncbi:hypothetical protein [Hippea alviniae]|uniref:hypothetical protein n=1 Tax=Hippea alviniae TaxID=1279027 RepID=UPI0003B5C497|nr:hypothetical protein [Hippea alviniae]
MGVTNWIIKLQKSKFARRFQYEPYIIKSVEYVDPNPDEKLFVIYREVDYFKSLCIQITENEENYFSWNVETDFPLKDKIKFDKIVFFVSTYYTDKESIKKALEHARDDTEVYCICFLKGSKFFETTLKLTDKKAFSQLGKELELFDKCTVLEKREFKSAHIKVVKLRCKQ